MNRTPSAVITPFLPKTVKKKAIFTSPPFYSTTKNSTLHNREPISKVKNLTLDDYSVGGNTALLDAVGITIDKIRENRKITKNNNVLFVIITDGEENSSRKYSRDKIKSMINSAEKEDKWDFIFLGANIDAIAKPVISALKATTPPVMCRIKLVTAKRMMP